MSRYLITLFIGDGNLENTEVWGPTCSKRDITREAKKWLKDTRCFGSVIVNYTVWEPDVRECFKKAGTVTV